ncbi:MAG: acyl-CoA dehydrogenase [Gammaproteobacteria bacterium]|nr:acyl-CoA dehydrogenase [Gammaproteobacteria bacterium]
MNVLIFFTGLLALFYAMAHVSLSFRHWSMITGAALFVFTVMGGFSPGWGFLVWFLFLVPTLFLSIDQVRMRFLSTPLYHRIRKVLPPMSQTERDAIESGTVWWEGELFRGNPDWSKLLKFKKASLTAEEQAFIDGPVEELCAMIDDWDITHNRQDLPPEMWQFLKEHKFFGMIIPKKYGGLAFSATAHSEVVMKVAARSISVGVTVMVPNSLGPAELLQHYGTDQQKDYYLPRLADGREIPCFALTGPDAGSDAGSIPDTGIVCEDVFEGKKVLGLRLNWEKRYITLGPVATVLGLAFKAYDPDGLLGDQHDLGITCALIPVKTPGIEIGNRHFPLNAAFQNGPNRGKDVFIPMDYLIGGQEMMGKGWRMLVESLSAGRGISLPAVGAGAGKVSARVTGAYARVRKQFKTPVGRFEGVEEVLARIAGLSYFMDAGRLLTLSALDAGEKPSVVTAILKYHNTEKMRQVVNDSMDVHGGRGICMGPENYIGRAYQTLPVGITVEGANILTRSMIIFGQGAIRCHPYLVREMESAGSADPVQGTKDFDSALTGHMAYFTRNLFRAFMYSISGSHLAKSPVNGRVSQYYKRLSQMSAAFAVIADLSLMILGGAFKRKEKLSGRFADALGYMFYTSAILKKFEDDGRPRADLPVVEWSAKYCLDQVQIALDEILRNFPIKPIGLAIRFLVFPLGLSLRQPNDHLGQRVASILLKPGEARDRLTKGIYINEDIEDITGKLEVAMKTVIAADPIEKHLRALKKIKPDLMPYEDWLNELVSAGDLTDEEVALLLKSKALTREVIMVDDFEPGQLGGHEKMISDVA